MGCGPRYARRTIGTDPGVTVVLRAEKGDEGPVGRGFEHPLSISPVRMTHVLSQLDVREEVDEGGERRPALPTEVLYPAGAALSHALSQATPDEEVVAQIVRKERRLGLFSTSYLTSLVAYARDGVLVIHLRHLDVELQKGTEIPEPWVHRSVSSFRLVPGAGMTALGPQEVAVHWRDPVFRRPGNLRVGPGGRIERRVILLESAPDEGGPEPSSGAEAEGRLAPETLRALADLEEERRAGRLSEAEYQARRRAVLERDPAAR
jgi:hypothetical protein